MTATTTTPQSTKARFVILAKSFYYGPSESQWEPLTDEDGHVALYDSKQSAQEVISNGYPLYLSHNEYSREFRIHKLRDGATAKDVERDWQYGRVITGGSLLPKPVKA